MAKVLEKFVLPKNKVQTPPRDPSERVFSQVTWKQIAALAAAPFQGLVGQWFAIINSDQSLRKTPDSRLDLSRPISELTSSFLSTQRNEPVMETLIQP